MPSDHSSEGSEHHAPTVLGIYYGHNSAVALAQGGSVTFALAEERLRRVKNYTGFPSMAWEHVLQNHLGGDPGALDAVVFPSDSNLEYQYFIDSGQFDSGRYFGYYKDTEKNYIPEWYSSLDSRGVANYIRNDLDNCARINADQGLRDRALAYFEERLGVPREKYLFLNHHKAHALSAAMNLPPDEDWLIFTLDSSGDNLCASINLHGRGSELQELQATPRHPSLGTFYREVTGFLGLKPDEHEFKVMGLAPYAHDRYYRELHERFMELVWLDDELRFQSRFPMELTRYYLLEHCVYERFDALAGAAQKFLEDRVLEWVRGWMNKTNIRKVALAGGVFMNVKCNQRIAALPELEALHVVPSASDESTVMGCCHYGLLRLHAGATPVRNLALGIAYSSECIESVLRERGVMQRYRVRRLVDPEDTVAELLASGEIVARLRDRSEWGARALGNRSLLADARIPGLKRRLNDIIKRRDFWMPFASSVMAEDAPRYILNPKNIQAPSMSITFDSTAEGVRDLESALHPYDYTTRPQIVEQSECPRYHRLLRLFKERTGVGGVLNTSFNLHGEPNVLSPEDAVHVFENSGLEHMVLEDWHVSKK